MNKEQFINELKKIDLIAVNTLKNCMQRVFEDGPKRDRRLWIGDLRLLALTDYATFNNTALIKSEKKKDISFYQGICGKEREIIMENYEKYNKIINAPQVKPTNVFEIT